MVHPLVKNIQEAFVDFQPAGVKREAEWSPVGGVVTIKVVLEETSELFLVVDVGAGGHKVATSQVLIKIRVVPPVQLVDGELPDRVGSAGAVASITMTLVWHPGSKDGQMKMSRLTRTNLYSKV